MWIQIQSPNCGNSGTLSSATWETGGPWQGALLPLPRPIPNRLRSASRKFPGEGSGDQLLGLGRQAGAREKSRMHSQQGPSPPLGHWVLAGPSDLPLWPCGPVMGRSSQQRGSTPKVWGNKTSHPEGGAAQPASPTETSFCDESYLSEQRNEQLERGRDSD